MTNDDYELINGKLCLKDGRRLSVKTTLMDHRTTDDRAWITDDAGRAGLFLHKPGFRCLLSDTAGAAAKEASYQQYDADLVSAYKQDAEGYSENAIGAVCTVRNEFYPLDTGSPGHVKRTSHGIVCVPDDPRQADAASNPDPDDDDDVEQEETERPRRRRRYTQFDPKGRQVSTTVSEEDTARVQDHQANMARIYEKLNHELSETWRQS